MRKLLVLLTFSFGFTASLSAHQHAAVAVSAPPAAMHALPPAATAAGHPVAPARSAVSHAAPSGGNPAVALKPVRPVPTNPVPRPVSGTQTTATNYPKNCSFHFTYPIQGLNPCPVSNGGVSYYGGALYIPVPYYADAAPPDQGYQGDTQADASSAPPEPNGENNYQDQDGAAPARMRRDDTNEVLPEFVFVLHDGAKIYAVAYSFLNDKLQYVTKQGVRHSVTLDSLDWDATQKSNEELGNTINLPTPPAAGVALNSSPAALQ